MVSVDVPWFWGTAAYPRDAVVPMIPPSVVANHGNIYYAYQPGDPGLSVPAGYSRASTRCWTGVCVDTYRRQ